jgi:hypothetical protein
MEEEVQDANLAESSEAMPQSEESATSDQQVLDTQTPTAQQGESQEQEGQPEAQESGQEPFHKHPRWQEIKGDRDYWRDLAMKNMQAAQQQNLPQQAQTPAPQEQVMGNTPEEREFWATQKRIARQEAEAVAAEKEKVYQEQLNQIRSREAMKMAKDFRARHPDVEQGSRDDNEIISRIHRGVDPEDAYWAVMGPKGVANANQRAVKQVKQTLVQKKRANVESGGVSSNVQKPTGKSFEEDLADSVMNSQGDF